MGTRWLPGSGQVSHYPALPRPDWLLLWNMAGSWKIVSIFATLNYTSLSEMQSGHLFCLATVFDAWHCGFTHDQ